MFRMLLEKFKQDSPGFVRSALDGKDPGEVQVRLIERGRNPDALFETGDCFVPPPRAQVKHAKIIQSLGIRRTKLQRSLQILVGTIAVVQLSKDHPQAVV